VTAGAAAPGGEGGPIDPESGVRLLGESVAYADGAEDEVLGVLGGAADRSTASDELAAAVHDWPTRYHFSRLRANLLRPFPIGPGLRVLDVGAGTGALARYLGERGARVLALEGTLPRARAAAARCAGLSCVEVACGPLSALRDAQGFDLVLCVGVYEHVARGGAAAAAAFLAALRALARPGGALLVAIENQLGLKYLLGYGEDHAGEPWLGVEGYPGPPAARTFSRAGLGSDLARAGFGAQRFYFPFPDYKLPGVILAESAYAGPHAADFVDQLVRWPCTADASAPSRLTDDRRAHRVFLEAGLGPEVANSFLVLAGADEAALAALHEPEVRAWHFGSDRQRRYLGVKTVVGGDATEGSLRLRAAPLADRALPEQGWLRQARAAETAFVTGRTVEQRALEAAAQGAEPLGRVLRDWRDELRRHEQDAARAVGAPDHPFRGPQARRLLPADHLDVSLSNFVLDAQGRCHYVDPEWQAPGPVDADLVAARALWSFAVDLVHRGVLHPWAAASTVDEVAERLGILAGTPADAALRDRLRDAEADLQAKIHGRPAEEIRSGLAAAGAASRITAPVSARLPFATLRRQARELQARLITAQETLALRDAELAALRESTSWKVTAPLRRLGRLLTALRGQR
jgi:SAM-dependent methyltransferase